MADFSTARVGDKVWDILDGACTIYCVETKGLTVRFECSIDFDGEYFRYYTFGGYVDKDRRLYWSEPEISDPPPPKRMKKVKVSATLIFHSMLNGGVVVAAYSCPPEANQGGELYREHFVREIEVEE